MDKSDIMRALADRYSLSGLTVVMCDAYGVYRAWPIPSQETTLREEFGPIADPRPLRKIPDTLRELIAGDGLR